MSLTSDGYIVTTSSESARRREPALFGGEVVRSKHSVCASSQSQSVSCAHRSLPLSGIVPTRAKGWRSCVMTTHEPLQARVLVL